MQTTLLGFATAFILALLAALIGPHFIDWTEFRPRFEAEASEALGLPVRVTGALDARLLPVPILRLKSVTIGGANDPGRFAADRLDVELSLGALMRGELRATELSIAGASMDVGLDDRGRLDTSLGRLPNLRNVTIDRLNLTGRVAFHDGASRTTHEVSDLTFSGDLRASAASVRGEGAFTLGGVRRQFRVTVGAGIEPQQTRVRFALDSADAIPVLESEGIVTLDDGRPRFEGSLVAMRAVALPGGPALPWRAAMRVKGDAAGVGLEQIEITRGADQSALRLTGSGEIRFGSAPMLRAIVTARSFDAGRLIDGAADVTPFARIMSVFGQLPALPIAAEIEMVADQTMIGGRPIQNIGLDLRCADGAWSATRLDMRAPGATRVKLDGLFDPGRDAAALDASLDLASADPDAFLAWLQSRSDSAPRLQMPIRLSGRVTAGDDRVAIDGLTGEIGGGTVRGRLAYAAPVGTASRVETTIQSERIDLDVALAVLRALAGKGFGWPDQGVVSIDAERATMAGQDISPFALALDYDEAHARLARLRLGESGGVNIEGSGAFDRKATTGSLTLSASAPSIARLTALGALTAPSLVSRIALPAENQPAKLRADVTLDVNPSRADEVRARTVVALDAKSLQGRWLVTGALPTEAVRALDVRNLRGSVLNSELKLSAERGSVLTTLLGIDGVVASLDQPLTLDAMATGAWTAPVRVQAKLAGPALDADATGTVRLGGDRPPRADLAMVVRRANLSPLAGLRPDHPFVQGARGTAKLALDEDRVALDDIDGMIASARLRGRISSAFDEDRTIDGEIGLDRLDGPALFALAVGNAGQEATEPLKAGWQQRWRGRLGVAALRASVPGGGEVRSISATVRSDGKALTVEKISAQAGTGAIAGAFESRVGLNGLSVTGQFDLAGIEGSALSYFGNVVPAAKFGVKGAIVTQGRSVSALANGVSGEGLLTVSSLRLNGLDSKAFDVAIKAADQGQPVDEPNLRKIVEPALAGALVIPSAQVPFLIKDGRLRIASTSFETDRTRAILSGGYDFAADQVEMRATLISLEQTGAANSHPELQVYTIGALATPTRAVDVAAFASWLVIRAIDRETRRLDALERGAAPPTVPAPILTPPLRPQPSRTRLLPSAVPSTVPTETTASIPAPLPPAISIGPTGARQAPRAPAPSRPAGAP